VEKKMLVKVSHPKHEGEWISLARL